VSATMTALNRARNQVRLQASYALGVADVPDGPAQMCNQMTGFGNAPETFAKLVKEASGSFARVYPARKCSNGACCCPPSKRKVAGPSVVRLHQGHLEAEPAIHKALLHQLAAFDTAIDPESGKVVTCPTCNSPLDIVTCHTGDETPPFLAVEIADTGSADNISVELAGDASVVLPFDGGEAVYDINAMVMYNGNHYVTDVLQGGEWLRYDGRLSGGAGTPTRKAQKKYTRRDGYYFPVLALFSLHDASDGANGRAASQPGSMDQRRSQRRASRPQPSE